MAKSFSEWLAERGHDEAALRRDTVHGKQRLDQLQSFFIAEQDAPPPAPAKDADGKALQRGDKVTITYVISGTHPILDPETGQHKEGVAVLNLDRLFPDGTRQHAISVTSDQVHKA